MILLCKLAAAVLVAAVLTLLLKKDQPAFALLVSVCTAAGLLAVAMRQIEPLLAWLRTLEVYFQGQSPAVLLPVNSGAKLSMRSLSHAARNASASVRVV